MPLTSGMYDAKREIFNFAFHHFYIRNATKDSIVLRIEPYRGLCSRLLMNLLHYGVSLH